MGPHGRSDRMCVAMVVGLVILLCRAVSAGQVDVLLRYQARLLDGQGSPVEQTVEVDFAIYDSEGGMSSLYTETQTLAVEQGQLSALIGSVTPIAEGVFDGASELWLGVTVKDGPGSTESELSPRLRIGTQLVADRARVAEDVPDKDITPSSVTVNGLEVIDATGAWVGPAGPGGGSTVAFKAHLSGDDVLLVNNVATLLTTFNELIDTSGAFDPSTGEFTVPEAGLYSITAVLRYSNASVDHRWETRIKVNGVELATVHTLGFSSSPGFHPSAQVTSIFDLSPGDVVTVEALSSNQAETATSVFGNAFTWFMGHKL